MDREELGKMKLEALRLLALEKGIDEARSLGKVEIIDRLVPKGIVERAKEAVAHAVEVVEEKAHEIADKVLHHGEHQGAAKADGQTAHGETADSETADGDVAAGDAAERKATVKKPAHPSNGFGVPSMTVHPHVDHGPREPLHMLDFEELPETYGVDECEVLFRDPFSVFAYWEITDGGVSSARAQLGQSADSSRLVMRMFTTVPGVEGVDRQIHDLDLPWNHGKRYLQAPKPGAHLRVAVGLLSGEGYFAPIAHSSLVRVPPAEPQPGPVEWMQVIPPKTRGRTREPLVVVRRGGDHAERGVRTPEQHAESGHERGGSSPTAKSGSQTYPFGGSSPGSSPGRRDGSK
ncbi:MAG: Cobalamin biosynthesis protein BluB [Myxococcales bacterium]|nr:Cobalamin biosynthesis protein BluB [Myxococcales bacterium]